MLEAGGDLLMDGNPMSGMPTQEGTPEWLAAEEVIADVLVNIPAARLFEQTTATEIMRALEVAGFIVLVRGIPMPERR